MIENVGTIDRAIRIVIGMALLSMLIFAGSEWKWLGLIGLVPLITALAGRCPAYSVMGIKTCAKSRL